MYKIIFIDIDGTLKKDDKTISKRVKTIIKKLTSLGIIIVLCTGRPRKRTIKFALESDASKYMINSGGGEIFDAKEDKLIYSNPISKKSLLELNNLIEKYNLNYYMNAGANRGVNHRIRLYGYETVIEDTKEFIETHDIEQVVINSKDIKTIKKIMKQINKIDGIKISNASACLINPSATQLPLVYCDIVDENTNKGNAIKILCDYLKINLNQTIGIGDNDNDIDMFKTVKYKVAMNNGTETLKKMADFITKTNNEDGVAYFLEKLYKEITGEDNEEISERL